VTNWENNLSTALKGSRSAGPKFAFSNPPSTSFQLRRSNFKKMAGLPVIFEPATTLSWKTNQTRRPVSQI